MILAYFDPKPDITAFELAVIWGNQVIFGNPESCPRHFGLKFDGSTWDNLDPEIKRHFTLMQPETELRIR